jgi:hypothetical protein
MFKDGSLMATKKIKPVSKIKSQMKPPSATGYLAEAVKAVRIMDRKKKLKNG